MSETKTAETTTRNAGLEQMAQLLREHRAHAVDVVVPAPQLRAEGSDLVIQGAQPRLTEDGVITVDGHYSPTGVADEGIAAKLGIPVGYLRRMRETAPTLYAQNINGWLAHPENARRSFLVRGIQSETGGIIRAVLSDRYQIVDNLSVLMATLEGVYAAGVDVQIDGCDLTERRMYMRLRSESVRTLAPELLGNYRSPFTGAAGADNPVVFAGFEVSNSEVGCGAFTITPRMVIEVCTNGLTVTKDALRAVHLGGQLDDGPILWSDDTQTKSLALVQSKARDAVRTFLDPDYMRGVLRGIEQTAATPIDDPARTIKTISKPLAWTEEQQSTILRHFIKGADATAGGVLHAVTSTAQTVANADTAHDLESHAIRAMELAAATR